MRVTLHYPVIILSIASNCETNVRPIESAVCYAVQALDVTTNSTISERSDKVQDTLTQSNIYAHRFHFGYG
jgi:hypothetical protein